MPLIAERGDSTVALSVRRSSSVMFLKAHRAPCCRGPKGPGTVTSVLCAVWWLCSLPMLCVFWRFRSLGPLNSVRPTFHSSHRCGTTSHCQCPPRRYQCHILPWFLVSVVFTWEILLFTYIAPQIISWCAPERIYSNPCAVTSSRTYPVAGLLPACAHESQ